MDEVLRVHHLVSWMHRRDVEPTLVASQTSPRSNAFIVPISAYDASLKYLLAGLIRSFDLQWAGTGEDGKSQELHLEYGIADEMIVEL